MMKRIFYILIPVLFFSCSVEKKLWHIDSITMQPAINRGDHVLVDRSVKDFAYGDIIGYEHIGEESWEYFISLFRIVGMPGDSIGVKNGIAVVNGQINKHELIRKDSEKETLRETLPNGQDIIIFHYFEGPGNEDMDMIEIPENCYFILGDTRTDVIDSRFYGPVHKDKIMGKVVKIKKKKE